MYIVYTSHIKVGSVYKTAQVCSCISLSALIVMCHLQDMTALVADFGLARMFQPQEKKESNKARGTRRRWA